MSSLYLLIKEVAHIERVHTDTVLKRAQNGQVPGAKKHGHVWRITKATYAKHRGLTVAQIDSQLEGVTA